jgi:hypothetical protein
VSRVGVRGLAAALAVALAAAAGAQFTTEELAGEQALLGFLQSAEIAGSRQLSESEGVTRPYKLTLRQGATERHCLWKNPEGRVKGYLEGWRYEIAAYRLDRHLGLNMVPPTVERSFQDDRGSCQLWVAYWIDLRESERRKLQPPAGEVGSWNRRVYLQRAFDNLIANEDRHLGNILLTEDWRMILIDHSRSFRSGKRHTSRLMFDDTHPDGPKPMRKLPRSFLERIQGLDAASLRQVLGEYLTDEEIAAVLARRDLIVREIGRLIEKNGEAEVLY